MSGSGRFLGLVPVPRGGPRRPLKRSQQSPTSHCWRSVKVIEGRRPHTTRARDYQPDRFFFFRKVTAKAANAIKRAENRLAAFRARSMGTQTFVDIYGMHICICICLHIDTYVLLYIYMYIHIQTCIYACLCIHLS